MKKIARVFGMGLIVIMAGFAGLPTAQTVNGDMGPSIHVISPLLFSAPVVEEVTRDINGNQCWAAPYLTPGSQMFDACTHVTGPGTVEALWTEEQLELARGGSGNELALWGTGAFTVTYADGTVARCASVLLANAVYRLEIPEGVGVGEGQVSGADPECTYVAPEEIHSLVLDTSDAISSTVAVRVGGQVVWAEVVTETETTVPIETLPRHWSLVETKINEQPYQTQGWFWEREPETIKIYLPFVSR